VGRITGGGRGILGRVMTGAVNGLYVTGGEVATGLIAGFIPLSPTGITGLLSRAASAYASGLLFGFINPTAGAYALAGGFSTIWKALARDVGVTTINNALANADMPLGLFPSKASAPAGAASGFPALPGGSMSSFPGIASPGSPAVAGMF